MLGWAKEGLLGKTYMLGWAKEGLLGEDRC